jgi:hypothetical protein
MDIEFCEARPQEAADLGQRVLFVAAKMPRQRRTKTYFVPRSEAMTNASPDQLLALLVALAAEINSSDSIRDNNALEKVVNKVSALPIYTRLSWDTVPHLA